MAIENCAGARVTALGEHTLARVGGAGVGAAQVRSRALAYFKKFKTT